MLENLFPCRPLLMMMDKWPHIQKILAKVLNPGLFRVWIKPLEAQCTEEKITLFAPNEFVASWVKDRLLSPIGEAAEQVMGSKVKIAVVAKKNGANNKAGMMPGLAPRKAKPVGLPIVTNINTVPVHKWRFSFDEFVVGPGNQLAFAASQSMCHSSICTDQLFLSSTPGLGKTHLIHAVGREFTKMSNRDNVRVAYLTAEQFTTQMILALKAREIEKFKTRYRDQVDVLLLEDVHFLEGKQKTQDEMLATLQALREKGCKIVLTSSFMPKELKNIDNRLVSRFCSGLLAVIDKPDHDTRLKIIRTKAQKMQVAVSEDISNLLAEKVTKDVRQLESCLHNLILKAKLLNTPITMDMAWQVLDNFEIGNNSCNYDNILDFICKSFDLKPETLSSKSRKRHIVQARNTAFYLARKHTDLSLKEIGKRLCRQHSTVLKGITNVEREISKQTPSEDKSRIPSPECIKTNPPPAGNARALHRASAARWTVYDKTGTARNHFMIPGGSRFIHTSTHFPASTLIQ